MQGAIRVLVLNQISQHGLERLPAERYLVGKDVGQPDAILVRSADLHSMAVRPLSRSGAAGASEEPGEEHPRRNQSHPGSEEPHDPGHEQHGAEGRGSGRTSVDR